MRGWWYNCTLLNLKILFFWITWQVFFPPCTVLKSIKRSSRATLSVWQLSLEASSTPDVERGYWTTPHPPHRLLVLVKCQTFTFKVCFIRSSLGFLSKALLHSHFWIFLPAFYDNRELWMPLHGVWKAWVLYECVYILPSFLPHAAGTGRKKNHPCSPSPSWWAGTFLATKWLNKGSLHTENQDNDESITKEKSRVRWIEDEL